MNKLKILIIPEHTQANIFSGGLKFLQNFADIVFFDIPDERYLLNPAIDFSGILLEDCLKLVNKYAHIKFDYIIGHANAMLWIVIMRIANISASFAIIPDFNQIRYYDTFVLTLLAHVANKNDLIFSGTNIAGQPYRNLFNLNSIGHYPEGISLKLFSPSQVVKKKEFLHALSCSFDTKILLYTGRIAQDKNIIELIEIYKRVTEVRKILLLVCYNLYEKNYLLECKRRATGSNIIFIHQPSPSQLSGYYNLADLFVSPAVSICETFGRSPIEAMACGLTPIVSKYNGFKETIPNHYGILVPTKKTESLQEPNTELFAQFIIQELEKDHKITAGKTESMVGYAKKFEQKKSICTFIDFLRNNDFHLRKENLTDVLTLKHYHKVVRNLWAELEGRQLLKILKKFLITNKLPYQPQSFLLSSYRDEWFKDF